ncbi:uncharacterized protein LKV04_007517 [Tautogolabrus adspersus]
MFLLIWVILLFTVERNNANEVASPVQTQDITAEAGLCVVIPCNFSADRGFTLESAVWYKCEENNCTDSDIILRLNNTGQNTQSKLAGRVSLLEPVLSRRSCSIVINDLNKSDSGSYQLRVLNGTRNGSTSHRANISVKDLSQKPTLNVPQLTERQQATLTCTAPGLYTCTGKHLNITVREEVNITVKMLPKILNSSRCINDLKALTCTCISRGDPLPAIKWPLLASHTEFTVITHSSKHTVNSTFILAVNNQSIADVECVSSYGNGNVKEKLIVKKEEPKGEGQDIMKMLRDFARLDILIAFLIGALLSAAICCLARKCHRKKHRTHGYLAETLEMVTSQEDPLIDAGQQVENDQAIDQEAPEGGDGVAAGKSDVNYSNLDFSRVKRKIDAEERMTQETETEYAEIKKGEVETRLDGEGKEEEEEEIKEFVTDGREDEDVALYSNVEDIMGQEKESVA